MTVRTVVGYQIAVISFELIIFMSFVIKIDSLGSSVKYHTSEWVSVT